MERQQIIDLLNNDIVDTVEARELLGCSRQYINELVKKEKLIPLKKTSKYTLFLKEDVQKFKKD